MNQIRCKMKCSEVGQRDTGNKTAEGKPILHHTATFYPVTDYSDPSPENKAFFAATPGGKVELSVVATQHFHAGRSYYLDFTLAE